MNLIISNLRFQIAALMVITSPAIAGARIDLRPQPPPPPGGYPANFTVHVDVSLVDTGNPQGDIRIRGMVLDFEDSSDSLAFPGSDGLSGSSDDNLFTWNNPFGIGTLWPSLPTTSYIWPLGPAGILQPTLPNDGEWWMGHIEVRLGTTSAILDVMNADEMDMNIGGAQVAGGYGGPVDPVFTWRAFTGELTGGVLELPVVPEPTSCVLLALGASTLFIKRKANK